MTRKKNYGSNNRFISGIARRILAVLLVAVFMSGSLLTTYAAEHEDEPGYLEFVTTANLNLRSGPSTSYERITLIPQGTVVFITEYVPDNPDEYYAFSAVMFGEISGYVASRFVTPRPLQPVMPETSVAAATPAEAPAPPVAIRNGNIEKISWSTMRHNILTTGTDIQIFDIRSGLTYNVRAFSLGNHADVETLTAQDTEIMRQTSGGFSWEARPVLATFNGRTFAAAIHTMPHAGSTIHTNGKNGHICLHFYGSTPHNGNQSWRAEMQAAVRTAFNHN